MSTAPGFDVHPAADLFPLMTGADFDALVIDMAEHGQLEPVVVDRDGRLIDGRNRVRACNRLGLEPTTKRFDGNDVTQFVVSHNLHRRHLTDSQRTMIAAKLAQRRSGYRDETASKSIDVPDIGDIPLSVSQAASLLGVKDNNVTTAKLIVRNGSDALQALASEGLTPITTAARVSELPADEQDAYVDKVRAGADPVRTAPPDLKQQGYDKNRRKPDRPPAPPRYGGNRRKHLGQLDALITALHGATAAFDGVTELDPSITAEEATRLTGDLSIQIRQLNRINALLKERTP